MFVYMVMDYFKWFKRGVLHFNCNSRGHPHYGLHFNLQFPQLSLLTWAVNTFFVAFAAIYNLKLDSEYGLNLNVGDAVHLERETDEWYYGHTYNNRHIDGIFPKNYIHIKQCITKEAPIVQEITTVLQEWVPHWKNLYVAHNKDFDEIKRQIYELINLRSKIISGTLPIDELKTVTRQATSEIDYGNKILGLDLVVRDKNGNLINPQETSTVRLYNYHKKATERLCRSTKDEVKDFVPKTAVQQYSNIVIVAVKNFTCKMAEDSELLMTLYDGKDHKAITENYVVRWSKDGLMSDLDQIYNLRVMFTDLGRRDLEREKIYLVCYVVRIGAMEVRELDHRRSSVSAMNRKPTTEGMRRPFGVAAMDITNYVNGCQETDLEREFPVPFINCEKDNLDQTLRKIINKDFTKVESKNQSLFVSLKLLREDLKQVREENPHLVLGNIAIARKMGFPEVILPGDVRNDLYLTLVSGEFTKGSKTSDKNVEVVVKVCNEKGEAIPGVISLGGGTEPINEFRSVIYYHEDKPHWNETFKIAIPIEEFKTSHLKFTFKHRSSNEAKDKNEKPFGMSYVSLMQKNGTTLKDSRHNLIVYKIDYKRFDEKSIDYLNLPSLVNDIDNLKPQANGLTISTKDNFIISTNICSTKLTQKVELLGLLNWASHKHTLRDSLKALSYVDGEEIVKFLQDILDALFNILMDNPESEEYDFPVFECLLFIISLVSNDWKYQHFEPVLDLYIKESFSATLAHKKLISVLQNIIMSTNIHEADRDLVYKTMKCLQYIMRFVSQSRLLYMALYPDDDDDFQYSLYRLFESIIKLMSYPPDICDVSLLREQGACLKYLPSIIPDILLVFDSKKLSLIFCTLLQNMPAGQLTKQKMMTIHEIVHSKLFLAPESRHILMPVITRHVKDLLESCEEVELCTKILGDVLDLLFRKDIGSTNYDITEIMLTDLRTVIQSHISMNRENPFMGHLVAIMIDIFRQMTNEHYEKYVDHFATPSDILDFLMEILLVFKELVNKSVFPSDWCDMIMLQNHVILKSLRYFSHTIRDYFFDKFESQAWSNFFYCAIAFMTQPALQLENFSNTKRLRIISCYNDMRRETGFEIRSMWFNLGTHKVHFVPSLVGSILEMTLIPEHELRKATIPIFFDMMQCEFYSSRKEFESFGDTKRDSTHIKAHFNDFEYEMISKLDTLVEGGRGDEQYKNLFFEIMWETCRKHTTMSEEGCRFVKIVTRLMERLLQYRSIINDENKESRMSCIVNLLDFYSEINRQEMYIRYVNKLYELHLECDNYTEAAYTLELHSKLLKWSNENLLPLLKGNRCSDIQTHRQLKETLYYMIIENYNRGKMWECAIEKCNELGEQCEKETYDYEQLSEIHKMIANFYEQIMKTTRADPEYFFVGYFGRGFPQFLQNKTFIYRGKEYERLSEFNTRILNEFPKAELLTKITPPGEEIKESDKQYLQIIKVDPIMEDEKRFSGKPIADAILRYYKVNKISKFSYSRKIIRKDPNLDIANEFSSLWLERTYLSTTYPLPGILRWFPVNDTYTKEISPLYNAIETLEKINRELKEMVLYYKRDKNAPINPLGMKLSGILDPKVMGGIRNYEECFFESEYEQYYPDDKVLLQKLKNLIADQMPLLDLCVQIHKERIPISLQPFHKQLEESFAQLQENVLQKYGVGTCDVNLEQQVVIRRQFNLSNDLSIDTAINNDNIGERSRLSSITKNQTSLKHLTSTFTFTPTANSNKSNSTKSLLSPSKSLTNTPSLHHKKSHKTPKEKRRSSKSETTVTPPVTNSLTQWYTTENDSVPNGTIFELRQELTPKRPLRSEVEREKRLSRPHSGQYSRPNSLSLSVPIRACSSSGNSSNRDSIGTTDSSVSEEDALPPPLPIKLREADYCNLPTENQSFLYSSRNSTRISATIKPALADPIDKYDSPPTPPPKPPKIRQKLL